MARTNKTSKTNLRTHEGAKAKPINKVQQLRRTVMACMLWENSFYENGESVADRIVELVKDVSAEDCSNIAIEARKEQNLRHVPLLICAAMAKYHGGTITGSTITQVISRADELAEYVSLVGVVNGTKDIKSVLSAQSKKGLANAFRKFDEYSLAKYNRNTDVKLRDVLFLCHAKPKDKVQEGVFKRLVDGTLETPDTWETNLSAGEDKGETFTRLLKEGKLGYMALLRNLRNMVDAGVDRKLIQDGLKNAKGKEKVLPFRFVSAARHAPSLEKDIDKALVSTLDSMEKLPGTTVVLVDVSASMGWAEISAKSDITRLDAAATLASVIPSDDLRVFSFSNRVVEVPARKGMAGVEAVIKSQPHSGTRMSEAVKYINDNIKHDRLIVITDEQATGGYGHSARSVPDPVCNHAYMINVASYQNGVGYGKWVNISGFSESVLKYIAGYEKMDT